MDYCRRGQWVTEISGLGRTGLVDTIVKRRDHVSDGVVVIQFGSGGPFEKRPMVDLREALEWEFNDKMGV